MDNNKEMTSQESLLIIQQMIQTAKQEQKDNGKGWILWGWLLFLASVGTVVNNSFNFFETFFFWNFFGFVSILAGIFAAGRFIFFRKEMKVKTYTFEIFKKLNVGFFISLMLIIVSMNVGISPLYGFPLLMNLYGFWILIYGALLNFKPSIIGACIMWVLAIAAIIMTVILKDTYDFHQLFTITMVLHGLGILAGYIIPGHIANKNFNNQRKDN